MTVSTTVLQPSFSSLTETTGFIKPGSRSTPSPENYPAAWKQPGSSREIAGMGWYSLLPPYLTLVETWIIRIAIFCAVVNISPWLLAILIDLILYMFRQIWHWIPIWGGHARGQTRPRAPSLKEARRRTLSLIGIMGSSSPGRVREESSRRRYERNTSEKSLDVAIEEESTTSDGGMIAGPAS